MVVGATWTGLNISGIADLLTNSHKTVPRDYSEWCRKKKPWVRDSSVGENVLLIREVRGNSQIDLSCLEVYSKPYNLYNNLIIFLQPQWAAKHLNRHKTPTLRRMSYNSRRQHQVPLLTVKNKNCFLNPLFLSLLFIFIVYSFTYFYLVVCLLPISFYLARNISLHVILCMMVYVQNQSWICQPQIDVLIWQKRNFSWSHAHPPL